MKEDELAIMEMYLRSDLSYKAIFFDMLCSAFCRLCVENEILSYLSLFR